MNDCERVHLHSATVATSPSDVHGCFPHARKGICKPHVGIISYLLLWNGRNAQRRNGPAKGNTFVILSTGLLDSDLSGDCME